MKNASQTRHNHPYRDYPRVTRESTATGTSSRRTQLTHVVRMRRISHGRLPRVVCPVREGWLETTSPDRPSAAANYDLVGTQPSITDHLASILLHSSN